MKKILYLFALLLCTACEPRVDMDMEQWGDHAYIDNVEIVKLDIDDEAKLAEYYQNKTPIAVTGVRSIVISKGKAAIDSTNFVATVKLAPNQELKYTAFRIYHLGVMVKPLKGTPKAGIVSDLSKREFKYRLESADGSKHDWTIKID